jgi:DNA-binding transcriptional LysR family regulator
MPKTRSFRELSCCMELHHMRYFVGVAENLSFTRAAEHLHVSQPSLTRHVHNLEEEIGVRLLDRSNNHVSLTEEGRAFLAGAKGVLALAAESVHAVQRLARGETGELNIAYSSTFTPSMARPCQTSIPF